MLKQAITTALRLLARNKVLASIKILGLAIGMACCLLTAMYIKDEESFDSQNSQSGQIYRFATNFVNEKGEKLPTATTPPALAPNIINSIPEIQNVSRIFISRGMTFSVRYGKKRFIEENLYFADTSFFDIFRMSFLSGDSRSALNDPQAIILTQSMTKKYFGTENPIGKIMEVDDGSPRKVTAVVQDLPRNSHLKFDFIVPIQRSPDDGATTNWTWQAFYTYVRLKPGTDIRSVEREIEKIKVNAVPENKNSYFAQQLTAIHLTSNLRDELSLNGDKKSLYLFSTLSLLILIVAIINYVSLATANVAIRSREIGIRKSAGALRFSLIIQFLTESILTCALSGILGLIMILFFLPSVNAFTNKDLILFSANDAGFLLLYLLVIVLVGLIAGAYPAFYLSSVNPANALKGKSVTGPLALRFRQGLIITQFTVSVSMIIGFLIVHEQLSFVQNAKLGLNPNNVIQVNYTIPGNRDEESALKDQWLRMKGVKHVSAVSGSFIGNSWPSQLAYKGSNFQVISSVAVDTDFVSTMGLTLKEGRNFFTDTVDGNNREIILNETAVRSFGISKPVIGSKIFSPINPKSGKATYFNVIGVVKDFHFSSLKNEIGPFMFQPVGVRRWVFMVQLDGAGISEAVSSLKTIWDANVPSRPFSYSFLDENFAKLYDAEIRFRMIYDVTTCVAIVLSCMGLIGLSSFIVVQRAREISIRKVLGATVFSVSRLLTREFAALITIASIIAFPIAYFLMTSWLQGFAYRISIEGQTFLIAAGFAILIGVLTISFQTIKAAIRNPITDLNRP
jgi:putative ABC transport system permease protein